MHAAPVPSSHPYRITVLRTGTFRLDGGGMFGIIPKSMWAKWAPPDADNCVRLATNCLLLDDGSRKVLVESGFGDKWSAKERAIYDFQQRTVVDALREVGVEPRAIDTVVVTHLHMDHAAGLTRFADDGSVVRTFPRAEIVVQRQEWEDALSNRSTMTRTYLANHVEPLRPAVRLVEGATEVLPGVAVRPLVGHTWGHQGVFVRNESGEITVFPGDLIPTAAHTHPASSLSYDMLPYENMCSKLAFLHAATDAGWRLVLDHDPNEPCVRARRDATDPTRYRLVPDARSSRSA